MLPRWNACRWSTSERLYSYRRVEGFPFIVAVGRTKDELMEQFAIRDRHDQKLHMHSDDLEKNTLGLHVLAHTDKLTGLPNRLMFGEALERKFERARRSNDCLSLILLDVDFFKQFNDRYGHSGG